MTEGKKFRSFEVRRKLIALKKTLLDVRSPWLVWSDGRRAAEDWQQERTGKNLCEKLVKPTPHDGLCKIAIVRVSQHFSTKDFEKRLRLLLLFMT